MSEVSDASCNSVAYALCADGQLYMRFVETRAALAESVPEVIFHEWIRVADLGCRHRSIAIDCGYIYGLNEDMGVDVQSLAGASSDGWANLARGYTVSIAVYGGTVYGVGTMEGGDRVFRLTQTAAARWGRPWQCTSKGRCRSIAIEGGHLYALGVNDTVYRQLVDNLSETSSWEKAFQAPAGISDSCSSGDCKVFKGESAEMQPSSVSLAIFGGGCASLAAFKGCVWRKVSSSGDNVGWEQEPAAGLPEGSILAITAAPGTEVPVAARIARSAVLQCKMESTKDVRESLGDDSVPASAGLHNITKDLPKDLLEKTEVAQKLAQAEALIAEVFAEASKKASAPVSAQTSSAELTVPQSSAANDNCEREDMGMEAARENSDELSKLSVKELKCRIAAAGLVLPAGLTEKSELVAILSGTSLGSRLPQAVQTQQRPVASPSTASSARTSQVTERICNSAVQEADAAVPLVVGSFRTLTRTVDRASADGYLAAGEGTKVKLLHVGKEDNESEYGWLYAQIVRSGECGWLHCNDVSKYDIADSSTAASGVASELKGLLNSLVKVSSQVAAQSPGYLTLSAGDEVLVEYVGAACSEDEGWLFGCRAGSKSDRGWFPAASVEALSSALCGKMPVPAA